ncbi:hypothetical protein OV203_47325 [Nannocystis sp. ILAH1]|uniref:hypothetical protein n=1 Tax=unclassified Nannocystis TaxID=2627009 RepID=UPI002271630E|nr:MULTISPECIES: hypothetical protein [unclassified Nannocystis]MCY0994830.1 hypothetical protein [Nannocystis sp. ILAH1]MCY1065341.1 hypothetical protein [Nannocystis sp. RBIL2]
MTPFACPARSVHRPGTWSTLSPNSSDTSFAAPVVTGGAALFIDAAIRNGFPISSRLTTNNACSRDA